MTTLAQLTVDIENYTENNDVLFLAQIPQFIRLAEKRIFTDAKLPSVRKVSTATPLTIGSRAFALPTDVIAVQSFSITDPTTGEVVFLLPKAPDFIAEMYPVPTVQGRPVYFSRDGEATAVVGPTPNAAYAVTLAYSGYPVSIVDAASGASWLGDNFDQLLLYGCLVEAYTWMKGSKDLMDQYIGLYKVALDEIRNSVGTESVANYR